MDGLRRIATHDASPPEGETWRKNCVPGSPFIPSEIVKTLVMGFKKTLLIHIATGNISQNNQIK